MVFDCTREIALKIAKMFAAQASAQPFINNFGADANASNIVAPQACGASAWHLWL